MGRRGDVASFELAREIGLDGVQVSFDPTNERSDLRRESVRQRFLLAAKTQGIEIASLGMGILNSVPLATEDRAEQWVRECIDLMPALEQRVVLLAFFNAGDIQGKPDLQGKLIERLKRLAPAAERAGVVLGLETWLNAEDHLRILDAVGSPAVQVYYDVANMQQRGYDLGRDIRRLGKERICQVHCKERDALLGDGKVDFHVVKEALDEIQWTGWLVIEGSIPPGGETVAAYRKNQQFLRNVFLPQSS